MISYELAKRLKDAGFPQGDRLFYFHDKAFHSIEVLPKDWKEMEQVAAPTLSELIEACGEDFYSLRYGLVNGMGEKNQWVVHSHSREAIKTSLLDAGGLEGFWGSIPEETVANLWLALNEKK